MKRVFVFIADGVGLRNFAFTDFYRYLEEFSEVILWNHTLFDLQEKFGYNEIKIGNITNHPITNILKKIKNKKELKVFVEENNNENFLLYQFKKSRKNFSLRNLVKEIISFYYEHSIPTNRKGIQTLFTLIENLERKTDSYQYARLILKEYKPDFIFITHQRNTKALPIVLAAKDLKIKTGTFIFSWDNLPKGNLLVRSDYYFVWSDYMKQELLTYYPCISSKQIKVTGTPQFEPHYRKEKIIDRSTFFKKYGIEKDGKFILFSGDDITTSPYDQYYLRDLAETIQDIQTDLDFPLYILFRRSPTDISGRYDKIIQQYKNIIFSIDPAWEPLGTLWNQILPLPEDQSLLASTVHFSEMVINIGSSMVFDGIIHNKPTIFLAYNTNEVDVKQWDIKNIYNYIHFQSMPDKAVAWVNSKEKFSSVLKKLLLEKNDLKNTSKWYSIINKQPGDQSSYRIAQVIKEIVQ